MIALSRTKYEAAVIRKVFKGQPDAYQYIVEHYMPLVYAVALAHTGNIFLADKVVVETFRNGFDRLVSLTDPKRLGRLLCTIAQGEAEKLLGKRSADWNKPRKRQSDPPIDMPWAQSELIDPLNEDLSSFSVQERKGILLHAFCRMSAKNIADTLKIERKEAEEYLVHTQENIEKALLKEVIRTLYPEVNNKERLVAIMTEVAGPVVAENTAKKSRIGRSKITGVRISVAVSTVIVLAVGGYFGFRALVGIESGAESRRFTTIAPHTEGEATDTLEQEGEAGDVNGQRVETAGVNGTQAVLPTSYTLEGRVVDRRFPQDGIAGLKISTDGQETETDFYGAFVIHGIPRGNHYVTVSYDGVALINNYRMTTGSRNQPIEITVDQKIPARFPFQGRVYDRNTGRTIDRFEVATCKDFPEMLQPYVIELFSAQQHPEGLLYDRFVTLGDYTMYVRAPDYAPLPLRFTIDENWDLNRIYEFPLSRSARLEATVYGPNELSVAGASIMPRQGTFQGTTAGVIEYTRSDSTGRFSIDSLPIGVQSFLIYHLQYGTGRAIVELESGKTTQIRIRLPRKGALTGDITVNGKPATFSDFRRRVSGSGVDLTRNIIYISPGQYEVTIIPEPVNIIAGIAPGENDRWMERRMEADTIVAVDEPTWLDFNFSSGNGIIQGEVLLRGERPRAVFVELMYNLGRGAARERIIYELGATGSFRLTNLPMGSGSFNLYCSPRTISKADFASTRALMDRYEHAFTLDESQMIQQFNVSL